MSDYLVTRLRTIKHDTEDKHCPSCDGFCCTCELCDCCIEVLNSATEAADEIERLRAELHEVAEHLGNALYSDEWRTREYAIVAFGRYERAHPEHYRDVDEMVDR